MAVYYQFKSSTVKESIPIDGHFITVRSLKEKIIESKKLKRVNFNLVLMNPLTKEEYVDEGGLIHRWATVLISRVPRQTLLPIVIAPVSKSENESRAVAVLKPNEAIFEKEVEGVPSRSSSSVVDDLPRELLCPLCKNAMKYAVFTSKCCFQSFCDKCIREHIITKLKCVCGATDGPLADYLIPNKTLRDTINRMLESDYSSGKSKSSGRSSEIKHNESFNSHLKVSNTDHVSPATQKEETLKVNIEVAKQSEVDSVQVQTAKKMRFAKVGYDSETMDRESGGVTLTKEQVQQQKVVAGEVTKKKKNKNGEAEMQWGAAQDFSTGSVTATYNPYCTGMNSSMAPHYAGFDPYFGYNQFGGFLPNHGYGGQGWMMPFGHFQGGISNVGMQANAGKANMKRKREQEIWRRE